jgi:multidrug efflux pump subunit AcrB
VKITEYILQKKTFAYILSILILLGGIRSYQNLGRLEFPDFTIKTAVVMTAYPGAGPEEVELEVTDVLETAVQELSQVKEIRSISRAGISIIYVDIKEFYMGDEIPQIWDELRRKVNDAQQLLPPGARPSVVNDDFGDVYGVFYAIYGEGYTYKELKDYADLLRRELLLVKDVASVKIFGEQPETIYLEISRARLAELGMCIHDVIQTINRQGQVADAGNVMLGNDYVRIAPTGGVDSINDLQNLLVRCNGMDTGIYLKDVATITRGYQTPATVLMRYNSQPALGIGISTTGDGNVVNMGERVKKRLEELSAFAPAGMQLGVIALQSETVTRAVNGFINNLVQAVGIVLVVLCITMGFTSGILMGVILILTMFGTFIFMEILNVSLQNISLGALILALGMLVDNAIVVTEGILVRVKMGMKRYDASIETVVQTAWPLLGATIVAILAFAAIGTSTNTTGEFLFSLFLVMTSSLGLSWVLAITLIPLFCLRFLPKAKDDVKSDPYAGIVYRSYRIFLTNCLRHRFVTIILLGGIFVVSLIGLGRVEQSFFPGSDRPQFMINIFEPEGTHIDKTTRDICLIEKFVSQLEHVTSTASFVGQGALRFLLTYEPAMPSTSYGMVLVSVSDYKEIDQLLSQINPFLETNLSNSEFQLKKFMIGPGTGYKIEAKFSGNNPAILRQLSEKARNVMANDDVAITIRDDWRQQTQVIKPIVSETMARQTGITRPTVADSLLMSFSGKTVGLYREDDNLIPLVMRLPKNERKQAAQIHDMQIFSEETSTHIPLHQVVNDIQISWENPIIRRLNRKRTLTVQCDPAYGNASPLFNRLRPAIESIPRPHNYELEWGGEYENSTEANESLMKMVPLFLLFMVLIILAMFNSIRQTAIVFLSLPLATIGVAAALLATGEPFGFMCLLGFLGLSGMLIKNAVVLIEQINLDLASNKPLLNAILDSSVSRFRPVCMAALTTVLGMMPLVGDPMFSGKSITIIGGLSFGTVLTLIVIPVLYAIFYRAERT